MNFQSLANHLKDAKEVKNSFLKHRSSCFAKVSFYLFFQVEEAVQEATRGNWLRDAWQAAFGGSRFLLGSRML